ncbi:MAG: tubulin-like doman-containing protein [Oscillospiraceae bacterium]|jgi:hypothetical protein|nr:tubulin-like doman-containing protein [Oscillospiraceae bacterium]
MIAPTLLVGLGGTGSKIVRNVSKLATEEQLKYLGFVVFDTDINELRQIQDENKKVKVVQTSTMLSVGEYLNIDTHARDTWFPVNAILNSKTLTEGAGQVRAISRLAFDTAVRAGKLEPLHEAVQELYKLDEDQPDQALRVIIVSSLAGGTGSGLIVPVALYIKNYLATKLRLSANITRGFFILPEVFDAVIPGQAERNNLRSNAYATLRELDAFLMKGDDTLPDKFADTVKMEFPRVGAGGFEQYLVRPYDFCFLYDAKNADGRALKSFAAYLDHAASCIYAQSIGPMNKRSNSSEDNTIRKLCAERGRNRYAGAGTSLLIYPFADVKKYIALQWASQTISKQWLAFDESYHKILKQNMRMKAQGLLVPDPGAAATYIQVVETPSEQNKAFAESIKSACSIYEADGMTKMGDKWDEYITALKEKILHAQLQGQGTMDAQEEKVLQELAGIEGGKDTWELLQSAFKEMDKFKRLIDKYTQESSRTIAYTVFESSEEEDAANATEPYRLERYLKNEKNEFIHPNAVRYFLYKVAEILMAEKRKVQAFNRESDDFFRDFSRKFDDPETEDVVEGVESLGDRRSTLLQRLGLSSALSDEQQALKDAYNNYMQQATEYRVNTVMEAVLNEGIDYVGKMTKAFEVFYKSFEVKVQSIEKDIARLRVKYKDTRGSTTRYVCATQVCLEAREHECVYTGGSVEIDGRLASQIYSQVRRYAMKSVRPKEELFFSDLFDKGIIGFFERKLIEEYGLKVNIDVITALEDEARYEEECETDEEVQKFVEDTIRTSRALSTPFIEKPLGEEREPIFATAYHPSLSGDENSPRADLVRRMLGDKGGVADRDIDKNMILFYQSFYGLRANNLSKFAPPEHSATSIRDGGEYFKAYFELIGSIHPEAHRSKAITPHIDKWWHVVTKMPDLDDGNQEKQETEVFTAFFWALVGGFVDWHDVGGDNNEYFLKATLLGVDDSNERLIVSNGTPCDNLYEVLDALSIYPELVCTLQEHIAGLTTQDVNNGEQYADGEGILHEFLSKFRVKEFPLGEENAVRSVFDIPLLMKLSVTSDSYNEKFLLRILRVGIAEMKKYLNRFYTGKELPKVLGPLIMEQFKMWLAGLLVPQDRMLKDVYHDSIFEETGSIIAKALEDMGLRKDAKAVREKISDLSK